MKRPEYEKIEVPRIDSDIREMNGKSTRRLNKCIEALTDLLDRDEKCEGSKHPADDNEADS